MALQNWLGAIFPERTFYVKIDFSINNYLFNRNRYTFIDYCTEKIPFFTLLFIRNLL